MKLTKIRKGKSKATIYLADVNSDLSGINFSKDEKAYKTVQAR